MYRLPVVVPSIVRKTKAFLASRDYRHSKKFRKNAIEEAKAIKTPKKTHNKKTEEPLARSREALGFLPTPAPHQLTDNGGRK